MFLSITNRLIFSRDLQVVAGNRGSDRKGKKKRGKRSLTLVPLTPQPLPLPEEEKIMKTPLKKNDQVSIGFVGYQCNIL